MWQELQKQKVWRQRRSPDRKLASYDDAKAMLREVGLMTQTDDEDLPSLFGAVQGEPFRPGAAGFGTWPEHAWNWGALLRNELDALAVKIYKNKTLYVAEPHWACLDVLARHFLEARQADLSMEARRLLDFLVENGPIRSDKARESLGMKDKSATRAFHRAKDELVHAGIVVARDDEESESHIHAGILSVWTQRFPEPLKTAAPAGPAEAREAFLHLALSAAVIVPRSHILDWFNWEKSETRKAMKSLLDWGKARSLDHEGVEYVTAKPIRA